MTNKQPPQEYEIGMVGLGVMGRNLLLNMADRGYSVAGYDRDLTKVAALRQQAEHRESAARRAYRSLWVCSGRRAPS